MAEGHVDDEFVIFVIKLQQENTLEHKQLSLTNDKSSFQSCACHFLARNRTVF